MNVRPFTTCVILTCASIHAQMADVVAEEQPDTFLKEFEAIWKQQAAEKEALRKSITKAYQDLNKLEGTKHGYPIGVSRLVLEAVQMGIFYPGQALQEAIGTFGDAPEVTTDWLLVQRGGEVRAFDSA